MDVKVVKRSKPRKRKRHAKVKRREHTTLEVRFPKRRKLGTERHVPLFSKTSETLTNTMQAETFWQNYEAAHEWQRRHSVVWWKSRCNALEQENALLRRKLTDLIPSATHPTYRESERHDSRPKVNIRKSKSDLEEENSDEEKFEFQVNEDMMKFFEHSIRHKLQLKKEKEIESATEAGNNEADISTQGGAAWMQAKLDGAKLLYGESSARILAMETALQASIDRHRDRTRPQYWPNIPLNLQTSEPANISFA